MKTRVMNGTYYEITGGMSDELIKNINETEMNDKDAIRYAADRECVAYRNTYVDGKRMESVKLYDPYGDGFYLVGTETIHYKPLPEDMQFRYSMLGRLKSDCEYFLCCGDGYEPHLWAGNVEDQIKEMRERWDAFAEDEKPEWLTMEQINDYERRMLHLREFKRKEKVR